MTTTVIIDRSAIFKDAWALAREAAARAGEAVRLYLGNAMRMAWARFRIRPAAEKPKTAEQVLHEQIAATDEAACGLQDSISRPTPVGDVALVTLMKQSLGTLEYQGARLRGDLAEISTVQWQATPCQQQQAQAGRFLANDNLIPPAVRAQPKPSIARSKAAYDKARKEVTKARRSCYWPLIEKALHGLDAAAKRLADVYKAHGKNA